MSRIAARLAALEARDGASKSVLVVDHPDQWPAALASGRVLLATCPKPDDLPGPMPPGYVGGEITEAEWSAWVAG